MAADIAGKILNAPTKVDQPDNPLKITEPWLNILTTLHFIEVVRLQLALRLRDNQAGGS